MTHSTVIFGSKAGQFLVTAVDKLICKTFAPNDAGYDENCLFSVHGSCWRQRSFLDVVNVDALLFVRKKEDQLGHQQMQCRTDNRIGLLHQKTNDKQSFPTVDSFLFRRHSTVWKTRHHRLNAPINSSWPSSSSSCRATHFGLCVSWISLQGC
jgi:hypothetical protein